MIFSQENNSTIAAKRGGPPLTSFDPDRFPEIRAPAKKTRLIPHDKHLPAGSAGATRPSSRNSINAFCVCSLFWLRPRSALNLLRRLAFTETACLCLIRRDTTKQ
jgi:hypothetical protein